jgi:hypothetical protein
VFVVAFSMGMVATSAKGVQGSISNPIEIEPFWNNVSSIILDISYSGTTATCTGMIIANANVNHISATFTLHRINANGSSTLVRTFPTANANGRVLTFEGAFSPVSRGQTYRLDVVATVTTTSGVRETVRNSITRTYN